jgi:hypothetical protein
MRICVAEKFKFELKRKLDLIFFFPNKHKLLLTKFRKKSITHDSDNIALTFFFIYHFLPVFTYVFTILSLYSLKDQMRSKKKKK